MLAIRRPRIERYTPKTLERIAKPPVWTRLYVDDIEISNSLENANWQSDPVLPIVCDECGVAECAICGLVHIVRTETQLLWMPPYFSTNQFIPWEEYWWRGIPDAHLISRTDWEQLRSEVETLAEFESFPVLSNHDLIHLWLQQRPAAAIPAPHDTFLHHLRHAVIASHPLEIYDAIEVIRRFEQDLTEPPIPQAGSVVMIENDPERLNTLYLDGDGFPEFIAFSTDTPHRPVIAGRYVLSV